jgi:hypothetical protein
MDHNKWSPEHENLLSEWADKALCYKWLHTKSYAKYQRLHNFYTIPVIVMSTVTGTANFAQEKLPDEYKFYAPIVIGCVNILAGVITTVQQFLHINELNEAHRVSMISWDKFYRRVKNELARNPKERAHVNEFIMSATEEYDRITETSPTIDKDMIDLFKATFDGTFTSSDTRLLYKDITKPDILDKLVSVKESVYKSKESDSTLNYEFKVMEGFSKRFLNELGRQPTRDELIDNLTQENIREEQIDTFIQKQKDNPIEEV